MDPLVIVFGLGVGLLVGMTGIGGGSLMTPILILFFGFTPITAIGTDLAYGAVTKTLGGWRHLRQHTVDLGLSGWMAVGSVPAAIGGVYVLEMAHRAAGAAFDATLLKVVAGALLFTGVAVLARALFLPGLVDHERESFTIERRHKLAAVALGVVVGFVLGITSAGSGSLIAVGLILVFRLVPTKVVGTDIFHAAVLLWAAAAAHLVAGNVDFGLAGTILLGSLPGVWIGSNLAVRVPVGGLRVLLAVVLIAASLGIGSKAGISVPPALVVFVPLGLGAVAVAVHVARRRRALVLGLPEQA